MCDDAPHIDVLPLLKASDLLRRLVPMAKTSSLFEAACAASEGFTSREDQLALEMALEDVFGERRLLSLQKGPPRVARSWSDASSWIAFALAVTLPFIESVLPVDEHGTCVIPHVHPLCEKKVRGRPFLNDMGQTAYDSRRACDNCDEPIQERIYFSCASGCQVDFCRKCHGKLQALFKDLDKERVDWVTRIVCHAATFVMQSLTSQGRTSLAATLASEWPRSMFERLVVAVVGVADALVVHLEDNSPGIVSNKQFWFLVGFLQVLYTANMDSSRGHAEPRVALNKFAIRGIDKCDAQGEFERWCEISKDGSESSARCVLTADSFEVTESTATFLTHSNLVPISFRQRCLHHDVYSSAMLIQPGYSPKEPAPMRLKRAPREASQLLQCVVKAFGAEQALPPGRLARPLSVTFAGEPGTGPGVTKEFLCDAMRSLLECGSINAQKLEGATHDLIWQYDEELRTYWFRENRTLTQNYNHLYSSLHACGALLGHAVFSGCMLPAFFPRVMYALLLRCLDVTYGPRLFTVADLASVSPAMGRSLERMLEYEGGDLAELFTLDWPRGDELTAENRQEHVRDYLQWFFSDRYASQLQPLSDGFRAVVGQSKLLQAGLVDAMQLEQIICGVEHPVDAKVLRAGASVKDWLPSDEAYLNYFWEVLQGLLPEDLRRFIVFVSACGRTPPRGWQDLNITIQRNGDGDHRLPTAFTCFNLFFLPRYSSKEVLHERLLLAISETEGFGLR
jgi:hypothetical protein